MSQSNHPDKPDLSAYSASNETQSGLVDQSALPEAEKVKVRHRLRGASKIDAANPSASRYREWIEASSFKMVALVGYSLLGLALVDFAETLLPPRMFDPNWQFQTITLLAGKVWAPLIGLMLVFVRRGSRISRPEVKLLGFLSWLSLAIAIAYFLLVPLAITNAFRIDHNNNSQASTQMLQQSEEIRQFQQQVTEASDPQEIATLFAAINRLPGIPQLENPQATKQQMLDGLAQTEVTIQARSQANVKIAQKSLLKNTLRIVLSATIAGFAFLGIWRQSKWVRQYRTMR
jgi:hypothetical protein